MKRASTALLLMLIAQSQGAMAAPAGPLSIRGTIRKIDEKIVEIATEGETLLVPREYVPKDKLQSRNQIVLQLTDEQILEVDVK